MKSEIKIRNSRPGLTTIDIEGTIGVPEPWQFEEPAGRVATYEKFQRTLTAIGRIKTARILVNIRSTGGDVGDALLIHDALAASGADITTRCSGYVASAATVIAQAASPGQREISANALYLIHRSTGSFEGNAQQLRQSEELLAKTDERIAAIYAARSGREPGVFDTLMAENNGNGRWLSPDETIAEGLADKIIENENHGGGGGAGAGAGKHPKPLTPDSPQAEQVRAQSKVEIGKLQSRLGELARKNAGPTKLKPTEDPSYTEGGLTVRDNAYVRDAASFRK
jgi:ATP-dependent protease ClpP protease subunit